MRTADNAFKSAIAQETTYLSRLWEITKRSGGDPLRFTDCDVDLTYGGNLYKSSQGFTCSAIMVAVGSGAPNISLDFFLSDDTLGVTETDLRGGVYDRQRCTVWAIDRLSGTATRLFTGTTGSMEWLDLGTARCNVTGLLSDKRRIQTQVYSPTCRADLGDARCKVDIEALKVNFTVTAVAADKVTFTAAEFTQADDHWQLGTVVWLTGDNIYAPMEVSASDQSSNTVSLVMDEPFAIQVGDTGKIYPGCAKTVEACKAYGNIVNMRAEPFGPAPATTG